LLVRLLGAFIIISAIVFIAIGIPNLIAFHIQHIDLSHYQLITEVIASKGSTTEIEPWTQKNWMSAKLESAVTQGRGKDGAWQLLGPIEPFLKNNKFAGASLEISKDANMSSADLGTAWVFVEANDSSKNADLSACLVSWFSNDKKEDINAFGKKVKLQPGKWIQISMAPLSRVELFNWGTNSTDNMSEPIQVGYLDIRFFNESAYDYSGSFYFDDVRFWRLHLAQIEECT